MRYQGLTSARALAAGGRFGAARFRAFHARGIGTLRADLRALQHARFIPFDVTRDGTLDARLFPFNPWLLAFDAARGGTFDARLGTLDAWLLPFDARLLALRTRSGALDLGRFAAFCLGRFLLARGRLAHRGRGGLLGARRLRSAARLLLEISAVAANRRAHVDRGRRRPVYRRPLDG